MRHSKGLNAAGILPSSDLEISCCPNLKLCGVLKCCSPLDNLVLARGVMFWLMVRATHTYSSSVLLRTCQDIVHSFELNNRVRDLSLRYRAKIYEADSGHTPPLPGRSFAVLTGHRETSWRDTVH